MVGIASAWEGAAAGAAPQFRESVPRYLPASGRFGLWRGILDRCGPAATTLDRRFLLPNP
jgi:hypothetical protein